MELKIGVIYTKQNTKPASKIPQGGKEDLRGGSGVKTHQTNSLGSIGSYSVLTLTLPEARKMHS